MEIIAIAKPDPSGNQNLICMFKEVEVDKITGAAGKPHTPHRYKAGAVVDIGPIYNRQKKISENIDSLKVMLAKSQIDTSELETALNKLGP